MGPAFQADPLKLKLDPKSGASIGSAAHIAGAGERVGSIMEERIPMTDEPENERSVRILLVEDSADDAELMGFALRKAPFAFSIERVETPEEFTARLDEALPDVVLCDYHLPRFSMLGALRIVREERGLDIPFIVVSRLIGEDAAVSAMQNGANDYLLKGRLGRLPAAIEAALERTEARRDKTLADAALKRGSLLMRSLLNSLPMRIAVLDRDGAILKVNDAWTASCRERDETAQIATGGNYLRHLCAGEPAEGGTAALIRAGIEAVIERREPQFALEYPLAKRAGERWEMIRAEPLEDSEHGAVVSMEDITARMLTHLALQDANERLHLLSRRILTVQEEERRAVALELHDDIGQSLAALKIALHNESRANDAPGLARCAAITDETLEKLRRLSYSLRPPQLDQFGLEGALRSLADLQSHATGVAIECRFSGLDRRPHAAVEGACYRIAQEALNNATRHAKATQVVIDVKMQDRLIRLAIRDDGAGFDEEEARSRSLRSGSLGLIGMAERAELAAGWLEVSTVKGVGTTVSATFPVDGAARAPRQARSLAT
jgi:signal transduction histidine kinase